ncbi:p450 domain containing protein, partial [Asbolus verrucosus]
MGPKFAPLRVALFTTDYKFLEFLLSSNQILTKSENYPYLIPWLGLGLLISDGFTWKKHRKILTPAFHLEILKQFIGIFESVGNVLIDKMNHYDGSSSADLYPLVTLCTLDIISESAMGIKIYAQENRNSDYVRSVKKMCRLTVNRSISPVKFFDCTFRFTKDYYIQKKLLNVLHGLTSRIINTKKEMLKNQSENINPEKKKMAFLDLLLKYSENGSLLSYLEIREEVDTFMFEGHDTTASGICFTLYCVAGHPEIQEKILQEQKELFGEEKDPLVTYKELQNMKYLEMVIKESLRLYPPVPLIGRYTTEDVQFKIQNIFQNLKNLIRRGLKISIARFHMLIYRLVQDQGIALIATFVGQKFAMLEMKSVISKIVRHFELIEANPRHDLILAAENGHDTTASGICFTLYCVAGHPEIQMVANPEYFPEPEKFNPERFENFHGSLPYAYIPFSAGPRNCIEILKTCHQLIIKYGTTLRLHVGPWKVILLVTDYKFLEFILGSNQILTKSENYRYLKPWLGSGLLVNDGDIWKQHRKILTPAFHFEILKQYVSVFESVGNSLIDKMNHYDGFPSVDLYPLVTLCTLDIISESAMGMKIYAQEGGNSDYVRSVKEMCRLTINRMSFKGHDTTASGICFTLYCLANYPEI